VTFDGPESKVSARDTHDGRQLYGQDPASYGAGRPAYPERVYDVLVARCGLREGSRVVEIGPGTGLATARILALGAKVTGIEPNEPLARYLQKTLGNRSLDVVVAAFEDAPLEDGIFELAVAANAFHWVDQEVGPPKLRRIVVPGGWLAIWGMLFVDPTRPDQLTPFLQRELGLSSSPVITPERLPFHMDEAARLPELRRAGFVNIESEVIRSQVPMGAAEVRALYASMTTILCRPPAEQPRLLDAIEGIVRDEFGGEVDRHFITGLYTARNP
jgi:SAM-dependent methyltransferase